MTYSAYFEGTARRVKDAGAVSTTGVAQAGGVDSIIDLGPVAVLAFLSVQVRAIDVANGDESYRLRMQLSNSPTFASGIVTAASLELGDSTVTGASADSGTGRRQVGFSSVISGTHYRYARLSHVVAGTSPSIDYTAALRQADTRQPAGWTEDEA